MSKAFRALKDASRNFEEQLCSLSNELFSAKIGESEDSISKKLRDLSLYTSKLRLLKAKPLSVTSQITEQDRDEDATLSNYGETVETRIIEQHLVKSATQAHAVITLIAAPDRSLEPEMIERKEKIIAALSSYRTQEATVQHLDLMLKERECKLAELRRQWDEELSALREMRGESSQEEVNVSDPLYTKLSGTVKKLQLMSWLASRLGAPRSRGYDWLADPQRRLRALYMAREQYTVEKFLETSC